ncbi:MAG: recombination protein RecR [Chloroflexi bacterium]|nr:recombination protein RecR [Chloroflexota bacterium]MCH8871055.1 recombination protein RecR [Chloroflexota bacterium]MCI0770945.1 recombination protein RecR [Chloroflexota bacterium]MCI0790871.1 recombination protein RecR [Chloroflexota bacterium]MCI0812963.1 recombination protein RecR [Chloroflexota bacterium]
MTSEGSSAAAPVVRLADEFNKLPGIGPKTAQRLTYFLIRMPEEDARSLAEAIVAVKDRIILCSRCYNITETNPCDICTNVNRDQTRICVVEEALDVQALERSHSYRGLYHVLHGVISPMNGVGPDDLRIHPLLERLKGDSGIEEIILATNPNLEGEATSMYIHKLISPLGIRMTRPARGLPVGGDLEYADEVTLARAIEGRQEF